MPHCDHVAHAIGHPCPRCTRVEAPSRARSKSRAIQRELLKRSFADFVRHFFPIVTGAPFTPNVATDAIIASLQAIADGRITRLAIAVPPGCGKTTLLALYSSWRLARNFGHRSIHASHAFDLAATESRRVRRLVESDEFRKLFPLELRADESTVAHWATTMDGRYFAVGTDGALTGRRAHEAVCDDPLNATDRFSKAARDTLWAWFCESLSTRLDGDRAPMIVVQQRLDRDDLIGRLMEAGGWKLVELAAEFDPSRRCEVLDDAGKLVWVDPRTVDGELLAPNMLPKSKLETVKAQSGAATYACQYLQRPSSDEDATVKRVWWRFHHPVHVAENAPRPLGCDTKQATVATPRQFERLVISVDMTFGATTKTADYCAIQVWGSIGSARYLLERRKLRDTQMAQRAAIKKLTKKFPTAKVLIEKAAGGPGTIEQLNADGIPNIVAVTTNGRGKAERLAVVSPTIEGGNAFLPLGASWLAEYVEELAGATKHDDEQDATAYALAELNAHGMSVLPDWNDAGDAGFTIRMGYDRSGMPIGFY